MHDTASVVCATGGTANLILLILWTVITRQPISFRINVFQMQSKTQIPLSICQRPRLRPGLRQVVSRKSRKPSLRLVENLLKT